MSGLWWGYEKRRKKKREPVLIECESHGVKIYQLLHWNISSTSNNKEVHHYPGLFQYLLHVFKNIICAGLVASF